MRIAFLLAGMMAAVTLASPAFANDDSIMVPLSWSALVVVPKEMTKATVADPAIASIKVHSPTQVVVTGRHLGQTSVQLLGRGGQVLRTVQVTVGYDLPAIRKGLKDLLPDEKIGAEARDSSIVLVGQVSDDAAAEKATDIVRDFIHRSTAWDDGHAQEPRIVNETRLMPRQQVMLRVSVGEVWRSALSDLGIDSRSIVPVPATELRTLKQGSSFKLLTEPDLVTVSGKETDFLTGGEVPVTESYNGTGGSTSMTTDYTLFGVTVKMTPVVLAGNRVRLEVQPEVSQSSAANAIGANGLQPVAGTNPKTSIELMPGESVMITGLIDDHTRAEMSRSPGVRKLLVLGELFSSSAFQHSESDLLIIVTPFVAPLPATEAQAPVEHFHTPSPMEIQFMGKLTGAGRTQTGSSEGPIGFMLD